jgi:hypothetical protein
MILLRPRSRSTDRIVVLAFATQVSMSACDDVVMTCATVPLSMNVVPQQITIAPGDSALLTASMFGSWTDCDGRAHTLRGGVTWTASNPGVVGVVALDTLRARVRGVVRGQTTIVASSVSDPNVKAATAVVVQ